MLYFYERKQFVRIEGLKQIQNVTVRSCKAKENSLLKMIFPSENWQTFCKAVIAKGRLPDFSIPHLHHLIYYRKKYG
ncbi:MAG: hypothetical protein WB502_08115 [Thermoactinomyces sp.]